MARRGRGPSGNSGQPLTIAQEAFSLGASIMTTHHGGAGTSTESCSGQSDRSLKQPCKLYKTCVICITAMRLRENISIALLNGLCRRSSLLLRSLFFRKDPPVSYNAPKFIAGQPWHVLDFSLDNDALDIEIQDSSGTKGTLKLPHEQVQVIEHVDQKDDSSAKKLYAHVRRSPPNWYFQAVPAKVYLGDVTLAEWRKLRERLTLSGVRFVWEQTPRREDMHSLIPKSWGPISVK